MVLPASMLGSVEFLALCPPTLRDEVAARASMLRFAKGRTVLARGAAGADIFHVVEGTAQITLFALSGREVSINIVGPGEMFGELAVLDGQPRSASVVAESDLRLIRIARGDFLRCLASTPEVGVWLARRMAAGIRRLTERLFEMSALNVQSRIHCELLRMAIATPMIDGRRRLQPAPTHAALAARVGTNREAVTRELRRLTEGGIIRQQGRTLEFIDLANLEQTVSRAVG